ncbi:hypothetical protein GUITHDRAFT_139934 [Guillardia theta CCMP2712]|uniref:Uncharacterized protein n=1 Tax=Guillardia theta (strain CCMP2712) TaxID=905079 RepID=L1J6D1_GUITC|nr:hypothetical protein GUITHDRAFT_139934 [Guillardia theta CCMP2712]EKX44076.1 hypothetical protein GUITHDRAFT_139934 [Guillardia theta CCMP2712]|eukprot:XP_005831056.1 hypothetical protein GUITHDRAFT_139934 [Guillardia theta CCMP2712]
MPQEGVTAFQNAHDHPLVMGWRAKKGRESNWSKTRDCIVSRLTKGMAKAAACEQIQAGSMKDFMPAIMAVHHMKREEEYLVVCVMEDEGLVAAINHRFHDASSMGLLLDGYGVNPQLVPADIMKLPPLPLPTPMVKTRRECLRISHEELKSARELTGLHTRNEVAMLLSALLVGTCMPTARIMVLHTLKPRREREAAGGDFSCLSQPLQVSSSWSISEAAKTVREHLSRLRAGSQTLVEREAAMAAAQQDKDAQSPLLIFDTWIGSGMASPAGLDVRVYEDLLDSFAFVVREYIIAYEEEEDLLLQFYGEFASLSDEVVDRILK